MLRRFVDRTNLNISLLLLGLASVALHAEGEKSDTPPTKRTNSSSPGLHSSRAAGPLTASTISAGRGQVSQLKTILGVVIPVSFFVGIAVGIIMLAWKRRLCTSRVAASSNSSPSSISNDFETHQVTETSLNC